MVESQISAFKHFFRFVKQRELLCKLVQVLNDHKFILPVERWQIVWIEHLDLLAIEILHLPVARHLCVLENAVVSNKLCKSQERKKRSHVKLREVCRHHVVSAGALKHCAFLEVLLVFRQNLWGHE